MAPNHARKLEVPGQFCDCEFVQCYRLDAYDGPIDTDVNEVHSVQWLSLQQLKHQAATCEHMFTPWLLDEMQRMHWLQDDAVLETGTLTSVS